MAERLDDLMLKGRRIIQLDGEFCFSIDSVLLAHFPRLKRKFKVLDLGTGTGVIPLLIADDVEHIHAIELNPIMASTARRSVELNSLGDRITVVEGDYRELKKFFRAESSPSIRLIVRSARAWSINLSGSPMQGMSSLPRSTM